MLTTPVDWSLEESLPRKLFPFKHFFMVYEENSFIIQLKI